MITAMQIHIDGIQVYPPESPYDQLRAKGWTLRPAAEVLGVHWTHLHKVLSGRRHSARLLARIADLPAK